MAVIGAVLGVICLLASIVGHQLGVGAFAMFLLPGYGVALTLGGRRDSAVLLRGEGDERQRRIQDEAANLTLQITAPILVAGFLWEMAHG
jgi:hypothetical protein